MKISLIGIAGGTSSGKSTLVERLADAIGGQVDVVSQDAYYRGFHELPLEERRRINYDHPDAFDLDLLVEHVSALKQGLPVQLPLYDFVGFRRLPSSVTLQPRVLVIVEGLLVLWHEPLRRLFDLCLFVDEDADLRLIRRIRRDLKERGRSLESVLTQYEKTVKPMHEQFILPSKRYADIVLPHGAENRPGTDILIDHLKRLIQEAG